MEDFEALCTKAADKAADEIGPMDMDAMDSVAGGVSWDSIKKGVSNARDATTGALSKEMVWVKETPTLTAEIVGGVAVAAIGFTAGAKFISNRNRGLVYGAIMED